MDMKQYNQFTAGISQYDMPQNYELEGMTFDFAMDDGFDYTLRFMDKKTVEWNYAGEAPQKAYNWLCGKGDDTTYLVSYELENTEKRTNHTWVIDLENWLVTRMLCVVGENPRYEFLIKPKYEFGEIKREGVAPTVYPRHGYTSDLVVNVVQWYYGSEVTTVHVYYCSNFYRITYPPEKAATRTLNEATRKLPSADEPTTYIKIKEGMYLFALTESNMEKVLGEAIGIRSNTMAFLQNYKKVFLTGRAFGTRTAGGPPRPLHITFGAVGKILEPTDEYILNMLTDPNPYIV